MSFSPLVLFNETIKTNSICICTLFYRDRVLDIEKVTDELEMLQTFCGRDEKHALISIGWDSGIKHLFN